jgi:uncharacterized protein (TIGR03000 family)
MYRQRLLALMVAAGGFGLGSSQAGPAQGGHGGGPGHVGIAPRGGFGPHGWYGGLHHFGRYYGYPVWGGIGVGFGYGYGWGYPYGYPYYPYGYGYPIYVDPLSGPAPNGYPQAGTGLGVVPGVPGNAGAGPPVRLTERDVLLSVRVPPDAIVRINGVQTTQSGPRREFVSSGLAPGRTYTFAISARWTDPNGETVQVERRIPVQGGERRAVDFLMPASSAK